MNGQMRNKARFLAHASTFAILAAAGQFGAVTEAQAACTNINGTTVISSDIECARVTTTSTGNVTNNAQIGEPVDEDNAAAFFVGGEGSLVGQLINNETITGGDAFFGAVTIGQGGSITGGIVNNGQIISGSGNAISVGRYTIEGTSSGSLSGGITNSGGINGATNGIAAIEGTMSGGLINHANAVISGGDAGVFIADIFTSWSGGIDNDGNIIGDQAGIQVGSLTGTGVGDVDFSGSIDNDGTITSLNGPSVIAGGTTFSGGIYNQGLITQRDETAAGGENPYAGVGIVVSAETFNGPIQNTGQILGLGGPAIWVTSENGSFEGDISNYNVIQSSGTGSDAIAVLIESGTYSGSVNNYSYISGEQSGVVIRPNTFFGNVANIGQIYGNGDSGVIISSDLIDGSEGEGGVAAEIVNRNLIHGNVTGLGVFGTNVHANITNERQSQFDPEAIIEGTGGVGVNIGAFDWTGNITNAGTIIGNAADGGEFPGSSGVGLLMDTHTFSGNISNSGLIRGDARGVDIYIAAFSSECECDPSGSFQGNITNSGIIDGGFTGLEIESGGGFGGSFSGTITNALGGTISGGSTGVEIELDGDYTGDFINRGLITGGNNTGFEFSVGAFTGNFTNYGTIFGGIDGADIVASTISGNITNNGSIVGEGTDTALYVFAVSMVGNVVNTNYLSAASNALNVNITNTLTGQVINSGLIQSTSSGTAVVLNIGNGTTFQNSGAILGNVALNGSGAYVYSAGNGSIDGSLIGQTLGGNNNDTIVVTGQHAFIGGTASNFASFTVGSGGTALMGATSEGGPSASPYSFSNVDALNVNAGGTLYIDQGVTLNVDNSYTQQAGGTLMFDLGAPTGLASATGTIVAGPGDYGQIIVSGPVTLNGTIAGFLDAAFAGANPSLEEVVYNDVITSNSAIIGDFTATALVSNNSLFQLFDLIDGNTVDLRVSRAPLGQFPGVNVIVGTADPFDGNIADRTNGIGSGGCGLAGPGWCFNRFAANEPGATQVMTDASPGDDPFSWLRTGVRRVGETGVWGRAVGVWGDTDGEVGAGIPGTDFSLGGGIVGIDHVFTTTLLAGLAAQWTTTDVDFDGRRDNADVDSIEIGAYGSWGDTRLYLNANVSYIWHDFEIRRFDGPLFANGNYDGATFSAYAEGGKIFETESGFRIQPIVALSYSHLETDAYSETGTATLLNVFAADLDSLKGMVGGRFAYPFQMASGRKWVPEARLVWSHEFMDDQASHLVDVQGGPIITSLVSGETFSRDTLIAGAGLTVPVSDDATAFIDYDAGLNTDVTTHTVSAGMRVHW